MKSYFRVKRFPWLLKLWGWVLMNPLKKQAVVTLKEEGLSLERASLAVTHNGLFLIGESEWSSTPKSSNKRKIINKIHLLVKQICLEVPKQKPPLEAGEVLYEFIV